MPQLDKNSDFLRLLFGALIAILIGIALANFIRYISLPTDENWFHTAPSTLSFTRSFPTLLSEAEEPVPIDKTAAEDSIYAGDLLVQINLRFITELEAIAETLQENPEDTVVSLLIYRPQWGKYLAFKVAKSVLDGSAFRKIPRAVVVSAVIPGGASDRAGMKKGDLIYRINGSMFRHQWEADTIMRQASAGKTVAYDIIRNNRDLTLQVTLASVGIDLSILTFFMSGLLYLGVGGFVLLQRPRIHAARLLGFALIMTGYFITIFMAFRTPVATTFTLVRDVFLFTSVFFAFAVFSHSRHYFPTERPELIAGKWLVLVPYAIGAIAMAAVLLIDANQFLKFGLVATIVLTVLFNLIIELIYRKKCPKEYKKLNRVIFYTGWSVCVVALALGFYLGKKFGNAGIGFIGLPLALIPLAYLYTIGRYRLFDLDLRIRRNIQYTIVSTIWIVLVAGILLFAIVKLSGMEIPLPNIYLTGTGIEFADTPIPAEKRIFGEKLLMMLAAIVLCLLALKLAKKGQAFINEKFDQGASDYQKAASALAEVMNTNLTMVDLAKGIVQKLARTMALKRVGVLFFRNQTACCCQEAFGFEEGDWFDFCIAINPQLVETIQKFRSESRFSVDYLTSDLKKIFAKNGFRNIFIIRSKERLVGALLIGEKRSESPFHRDDMEFLTTISRQASVAIENAFLYEELAEQERLKHELEIARQIQLASLPQSTPIMDGLEIDGVSIPAMEVGGDYFDYLNGPPNEITIIVGDVSGKGTSAALYMSKVQGILRSLHGFDLKPRDLFIHANNLLWKDLEKKSFITAIGGFFNSSTHVVCLARAGHLPLYYYNATSNKVELVTPKGLGLGLKNSTVFAKQIEEKKIAFHPGDVFLFITDGITEAQNTKGEDFGEERVGEILLANHHLPSQEIRNTFFTALNAFADNAYQHDDQTLVVVKVK